MARILQGCKNTLKKNTSIAHLSFDFQHSMQVLWHSQVSRLFNHVSF